MKTQASPTRRILTGLLLCTAVYLVVAFIGAVSLMQRAPVDAAPPLSVNYQGMVLTRVLKADAQADTGTKACSRLIGSNGRPMVCKNAVESFPYLGNAGCRQFYPHAVERVSTFPGHGAHGGRYDIVCLGASLVGDVAPASTCSHTFGLDTCTTCPQCAHNLDCDESLGGNSNFADGAIVRCFDDQSPLPTPPAPVASAPPEEPAEDQVLASAAIADQLEIDDRFIVEVTGDETGQTECAKHNKVCVGYFSANREYCKAFYPNAEVANAATGVPHDFLCRGGTTSESEACAGTVKDTCKISVVSPATFSCADTVEGEFDAVFAECEDPLLPELIKATGGAIPPVSTPSYDPLSGSIFYAVTVQHPLNEQVSIQVQHGLYSDDPESIAWEQSNLLPVPGVAPGDASVTLGRADQDSQQEYQIGSVDPIDTDQHNEIRVDFIVDASALTPGQQYQLKVVVKDRTGNTTVDYSPGFDIEEFIPDGLRGSADTPEDTGANDDIDGDGIPNGEDSDIDGDGIPNAVDPDVDGDGKANVFDEDIDGDGLPNESDSDDDGDFVSDDNDEQPSGIGNRSDIDGDGLGNPYDDDIDGDGVTNDADGDVDGDGYDADWDADIDSDGIANTYDEDVDSDGELNASDRDDDADGIEDASDEGAEGRGTPEDVDGDERDNAEDEDVDGDAIPNAIDPDIDGDGVANVFDDDVDGDTTPNESDSDADGDEQTGSEDEEPNGRGTIEDIDGDGTPNERDYDDIDGDGLYNHHDPDMDGDGIPNGQDPDADGDQVPNQDDPDMDGDGVNNVFDDDVDSDGNPNTTDSDDDGDGTPDIDDNSPTGLGTQEDIDGDGIENEADPDMDGDGLLNGQDPDIDGDGIPNEQDPDMDGDGVLNDEDDDTDGDGVENDEDRSTGGANGFSQGTDGENEATSIPLVTTRGRLRGAVPNCFVVDCSSEELTKFIQMAPSILEQGGEMIFFDELETSILEFLVQLLEEGYGLDELSADEVTRSLATRIGLEVLKVRGKATPAQIENFKQTYYKDVTSETLPERMVNYMTFLKIVDGYPDQFFRMKKPTKYVEAAKMIVNTAAFLSEDQVGQLLKELRRQGQDDNNWFLPFVLTLQQLNIPTLLGQMPDFGDYDLLATEINLLDYLRLFDLISKVIGIENVLSAAPSSQSVSLLHAELVP